MSLGYAVWRRWRVYGEEGLVGREADLWLQERTLTLEHAGEPLSRYSVEFAAGTGKPRAVARPVLFGTTILLRQPTLFGFDSLGEGGWLKAVRLADYAPRMVRPLVAAAGPVPPPRGLGVGPSSPVCSGVRAGVKPTLPSARPIGPATPAPRTAPRSNGSP